MADASRHLPLIDAIKAVAAQLIVLHHLAWYGPMSDISADLFPLLDHGQAWLASNLAALLFYRLVEERIGSRFAAWFKCRTARPAY